MTKSLLLLPLLLSAALPSLATAAEAFVLGTRAPQRAVDAALLPKDTDLKAFAKVVEGVDIGLYARLIPEGEVTLELGLLETQADGPGKKFIQVAANGTPLDAQLDVFAKAGGKFRPFVYRKTFHHDGGTLALKVTGLGAPASVGFARILDHNGVVLAQGAAASLRTDRVRMEDARSRPVRPISAEEAAHAFYNVDHAPVGAWASFIYGMEGSGGMMVARKTDTQGNLVMHDGVIVASRRAGKTRAMPFCDAGAAVSPTVSFLGEKDISRKLGACTDTWKTPAGFAWTHYSPTRSMKDWDTATKEERERFALPATWMAFDLDNTDGKEELAFLFGLRQPAEKASWKSHDTAFTGWSVNGGNALAVRDGVAETPDSASVEKEFGIKGATASFVVRVPAGQKKSVTFLCAHLTAGRAATLADRPLVTAASALFKDMTGVLAAAAKNEADAVAQSRALDARLDASGISAERRLLAAHALHSYRFNTLLFTDEAGDHPVFSVQEGECAFLNTLDLTADHAFLELALHPWTVRNELDGFAKYYSYREDLVGPGGRKAASALSFSHDMGKAWSFQKPGTRGAYGEPMSQEELQNWLICAGLYYKTTGDRAWLAGKRDLLKDGLASMLLRDDTDPAARDGITTLRSAHGEITTYDAMDDSLKRPTDNLYIAVKSFGTYLVLAPLFDALDDTTSAAECRAAALRTSRAVDAKFDEKTGTFPALFTGKTHSHIIPAVEGLVYPYAMGLAAEISPEGPHGVFIQHLRRHIDTILRPGVCLDAKTGAWLLSDSSPNTWESKVYLNQAVVEDVLGLRDDRTGGPVDRMHLAYQILGSPAVGWTCQITTHDHVAWGCRHYPRGVTNALWWIAKPDAKAKE